MSDMTGSNGVVSTEKLWMIRKKDNHIVGPVSESQVKEMVDGGLLERDDELCPENGYWFYLHEVAEVRRFLGIEHVFVRRGNKGEPHEATLTEDTLTAEMATQAALSQAGPDAFDRTMQIQRPAVKAHPQSVQRSPGADPITAARAAELESKPALSAEELAARYKRPLLPTPLAAPGDDASQDASAKGRFFEGAKLWILITLGGAVVVIWGISQILAVLKKSMPPMAE
jgi:hypothetical protein